jgi:hypothetical protein
MTHLLQLNPIKGLPYWFISSEIHFPLGKSKKIDLNTLSSEEKSLLEAAIQNETLLDLTPREDKSKSVIQEVPKPPEEEIFELSQLPPMALYAAKQIINSSVISAKRQISAVDSKQRIPAPLDIFRACLRMEQNGKDRKSLTSFLQEKIRKITAQKFSKIRHNIDTLVENMHSTITEEDIKTVEISPADMAVVEEETDEDSDVDDSTKHHRS